MSSLSPQRYFSVNLANVLQHLGLALMIGGMLALGAFVAPALFANVPRLYAGKTMTLIFMRYDNVLLAGIILVVAGEVIRAAAIGIAPRLISAVRLATVVLLTAMTAYSLFVIHPPIEQYQQQGVLRGVGEAGYRFDQLHKQSEALYKSQLLVAVVLLVLVAVAPRRRYQTGQS